MNCSGRVTRAKRSSLRLPGICVFSKRNSFPEHLSSTHFHCGGLRDNESYRSEYDYPEQKVLQPADPARNHKISDSQKRRYTDDAAFVRWQQNQRQKGNRKKQHRHECDADHGPRRCAMLAKNARVEEAYDWPSQTDPKKCLSGFDHPRLKRQDAFCHWRPSTVHNDGVSLPGRVVGGNQMSRVRGEYRFRQRKRLQSGEAAIDGAHQCADDGHGGQ